MIAVRLKAAEVKINKGPLPSKIGVGRIFGHEFREDLERFRKICQRSDAIAGLGQRDRHVPVADGCVSAIRDVVRISRDQRFIDGECLLEFLQGATVISQFQQARARITKLDGEFASPKRVCGIEIDQALIDVRRFQIIRETFP